MDTEDWLIRTPTGWKEPSPPPCPHCAGTRHLVGWLACLCGAGPFTGGHRTWCCTACRHETVIGCSGHVGRGPMEEYGCR